MDDRVVKYIKELEKEIYKDFEDLVNINSFSQNIEGLERVAHTLQAIGLKHGIKLDKVYSPKKERPHLIFNKELERDFYALIGHFDTVHSLESGFLNIQERDGIYYGPGTNDMKSGLIVALYSLAILKKLYPNRNLPIKILFNSDEEIGSYDSLDIMKNEFSKAKAGFVFESCRVDGYSIVTARKGGISLDIDIKGKAAHAGVEPQKGINAITTAAKIILKLNRLNDFKNGITLGCNVIQGGIVKNTVAPFCKIGVDIRYVKKEQYRQIMKDFENILYEPNDEGTEISYTIEHQKVPLEKTPASQELYKLYKQTADEIGIKCNETATGGGSDANILSDFGVPCLDGLGAVGNFSHTTKEFTIKESIPKKIEHFVKFIEKLI